MKKINILETITFGINHSKLQKHYFGINQFLRENFDLSNYRTHKFEDTTTTITTKTTKSTTTTTREKSRKFWYTINT